MEAACLACQMLAIRRFISNSELEGSCACCSARGPAREAQRTGIRPTFTAGRYRWFLGYHHPGAAAARCEGKEGRGGGEGTAADATHDTYTGAYPAVTHSSSLSCPSPSSPPSSSSTSPPRSFERSQSKSISPDGLVGCRYDNAQGRLQYEADAEVLHKLTSTGRRLMVTTPSCSGPRRRRSGSRQSTASLLSFYAVLGTLSGVARNCSPPLHIIVNPAASIKQGSQPFPGTSPVEALPKASRGLS